MATNTVGGGSYNPSIDVNSPYFVNVNDMSGNSLVNPPLKDTNYHTWKRAMEIFIGMKHKTGFIDGSLTCPPVNSSLYSVWTRCNLIVVSWILNSVVAEISQSILYIDTAHKMLKVLQERYSQGNEPRVFELQQSIHSLHQGNLSVAAYFAKLETLWIDLNTLSLLPSSSRVAIARCNYDFMEKLNKREENYFRMIFLMGLHDSYSAIRGQILLMKPISPVNEVFQLIVQEEKQRVVGIQAKDINEHMAMATHSNFPNSVATNSYVPKFNKSEIKCSFCHGIGHMRDKCYKIHGYPPGWRVKGKENREYKSKGNTSHSRSGFAHQVSGSTIQDKVLDDLSVAKSLCPSDPLTLSTRLSDIQLHQLYQQLQTKFSHTGLQAPCSSNSNVIPRSNLAFTNMSCTDRGKSILAE